MTPSPIAVAEAAFRIGRDLVLEIFQIWRRDLQCLDALILLTIATANVDGILFDPELRQRYGKGAPIGPDLPQPIASSAVAVILGLPRGLIQRRIVTLAARGECLITPEEMLISEYQLEGTHRTAVIQGVYRALWRSHARLSAAGVFERIAPPPSSPPDHPPIHSASAHAAKYLLRTLDALEGRVGDVRDSIILMELMRLGEPGSEAAGRPVRPSEVGDELGLSPDAARRRIRRLLAGELCVRGAGGGVSCDRILAEPWFGEVLERNLLNLFQLFAGLAEIGAVADFESQAVAAPGAAGRP